MPRCIKSFIFLVHAFILQLLACGQIIFMQTFLDLILSWSKLTLKLIPRIGKYYVIQNVHVSLCSINFKAVTFTGITRIFINN